MFPSNGTAARSNSRAISSRRPRRSRPMRNSAASLARAMSCSSRRPLKPSASRIASSSAMPARRPMPSPIAPRRSASYSPESPAAWAMLPSLQCPPSRRSCATTSSRRVRGRRASRKSLVSSKQVISRIEPPAISLRMTDNVAPAPPQPAASMCSTLRSPGMPSVFSAAARSSTTTQAVCGERSWQASASSAASSAGSEERRAAAARRSASHSRKPGVKGPANWPASHPSPQPPGPACVCVAPR